MINYIDISFANNLAFKKANSTTYSQLLTERMSSAMEIPLIFCNITKYISDTNAIKLSIIYKYFYKSLAGHVNLTSLFTMKQLKKNKKFQVRKIAIRSSGELRELFIHPLCIKIHELIFL
jgi:hypothetical protein